MYQYHTLGNGLRIILSHTPSRVVYSGVYVGVGSRDEFGRDEGIAHFVEHSIFKGTTHRRAHHILNRIDGVGGELNAFTTKEETCIYASSMSEHLERCLELFADVLFCSTFPDNEIAREKEVVVEEIDSYNDSPAELIYDHFEQLAFDGHPLAHNILGTKHSVRRFTSERLRQRMAECYVPSRMVVSVVGNVDFDRLVRLCERHFGAYASHPVDDTRTVAPVVHPFEQHLHRRTHQTHLLLGCEAPSLYASQKTAFTLLNNMLGGPAMNSRLGVAVRERYGFCYTVESQYVPFSDSGLFYIYAGVAPSAGQRTVNLIKAELARLCSDRLTPRALRAAQQQFVGQMAIQADIGMNEMQSIGKAYLSFDHVDSLEEMTADIMSLTPDALLAAAQQYLAPDKLSLLVYN